MPPKARTTKADLSIDSVTIDGEIKWIQHHNKHRLTEIGREKREGRVHSREAHLQLAGWMEYRSMEGEMSEYSRIR